MCKLSLQLVWASILVLFLACPSLAQEEYVNGIDANFPPFAYVDENGDPSGFDVDAVDWIADEMGFEVKHKPMDWDGIIPNLVAEKIDFIASGMSITEKRKEKVNFSIPYWEIKQVALVRDDSELSMEEVLNTGKRIGVQRGTTTADMLEERIPEEDWDIKVRSYDSAPMAVSDLVNGRIDAAAMDDAPAAEAKRNKPVKVLGAFEGEVEKFGYAVRKEDEELLQTLNEGLERLMDDPYWDELIEKYEPGQ
ncbi:MAG: ABC transporter substrate-binding protein [Desulfohalobiaceae bacterium]